MTMQWFVVLLIVRNDKYTTVKFKRKNEGFYMLLSILIRQWKLLGRIRSSCHLSQQFRYNNAPENLRSYGLRITFNINKINLTKYNPFFSLIFCIAYRPVLHRMPHGDLISRSDLISLRAALVRLTCYCHSNCEWIRTISYFTVW